MKIEVGKSYRGRDGTKIDVFAVKEYESRWPFLGTHGGTQVDYTSEGCAGYPPTEERSWDIVAEWGEPVPDPDPDPLRDLIVASFENPESWPMTDGQRIALLQRLYWIAKGGTQ